MYRPVYHFSPPVGWMNDPNGLVYYEGKWHLFYQHTPNEVIWGPMHWGHAISSNLVDWEPLKIALYPDELGAIYSGSVAVREESPKLVACFTHAGNAEQVQSLAFSDDGGSVWKKFKGNPVLRGQSADFRDPKIFRFHTEWRMVICAGLEARLYASPDLLTWNFIATFCPPKTGGVWECPDLFQVGEDWILLGSFAHWEAPPGASSTLYWIGSFDGATFIPKIGPECLSFGPDDYAAVSWDSAPDNQKVLIGWMSHWAYARLTPTEREGWRGIMTLPRIISIEDGHLVQRPPKELRIRRGRASHLDNDQITIDAEAFEVFLEADLSSSPCALLSFRFINTEGEEIVISYERGWLHLDRRISGQTEFHAGFAQEYKVQIPLRNDRLLLEIFVDCCSIEVFAQGGRYYGAALIFPTKPIRKMQYCGLKEVLISATAYSLHSNSFYV